MPYQSYILNKPKHISCHTICRAKIDFILFKAITLMAVTLVTAPKNYIPIMTLSSGIPTSFFGFFLNSRYSFLLVGLFLMLMEFPVDA